MAKKRFFEVNIALLLLAAPLMISCSNSLIRPNTELSGQPEVAAEYLAKPGDTMMVKVWGEQQLTGEVLVREDGKFTMPLIGDVLAEGKNLKDINQEVTTRLQEFIPGASVTVSVAQSAPIRYFLSGQFFKSGEYRTDSRITFLQAISTGGGFAPFADESSVMLIRRSPQGELRYELDYNRVVDGKEPNPLLKDGDTLAVK